MTRPGQRPQTSRRRVRPLALDARARTIDGRPEGAEWRRWMEGCGQRVRHVRTFLGLSQEQLAAAAGVSQGAVSRLETTRGLATPLLVVLKIDLALRRDLRRRDPQVLTAELQQALEADTLLFAPLEIDGEVLSPVGDPQLEELVRLYRQTPDAHRSALLAIVRAALPGLRRVLGVVVAGLLAG